MPSLVIYSVEIWSHGHYLKLSIHKFVTNCSFFSFFVSVELKKCSV